FMRAPRDNISAPRHRAWVRRFRYLLPAALASNGVAVPAPHALSGSKLRHCCCSARCQVAERWADPFCSQTTLAPDAAPWRGSLPPLTAAPARRREEARRDRTRDPLRTARATT